MPTSGPSKALLHGLCARSFESKAAVGAARWQGSLILESQLPACILQPCERFLAIFCGNSENSYHSHIDDNHINDIGNSDARSSKRIDSLLGIVATSAEA